MPATGTVLAPVAFSTASEQRKINKKRKLAESTEDTDAADRPKENTTTVNGAHHDHSGRGASFLARLGDTTSYSPERRIGAPHNTFSSQQEQLQRNQDALLLMHASEGNSAQADQNADDEVSDETDEAEIQGMSRMLDDGKGRMRMF